MLFWDTVTVGSQRPRVQTDGAENLVTTPLSSLPRSEPGSSLFATCVCAYLIPVVNLLQKKNSSSRTSPHPSEEVGSTSPPCVRAWVSLSGGLNRVWLSPERLHIFHVTPGDPSFGSQPPYYTEAQATRTEPRPWPSAITRQPLTDTEASFSSSVLLSVGSAPAHFLQSLAVLFSLSVTSGSSWCIFKPMKKRIWEGSCKLPAHRSAGTLLSGREASLPRTREQQPGAFDNENRATFVRNCPEDGAAVCFHLCKSQQTAAPSDLHTGHPPFLQHLAEEVAHLWARGLHLCAWCVRASETPAASYRPPPPHSPPVMAQNGPWWSRYTVATGRYSQSRLFP
ncbi:guanine nucleotide-binding protein subunit alpha-12 isoform X2 [Physeter macrocephalus]|uniref:Guanine nucleotide-binding protein subunit alpha-12 isoform X2 n=1 Tax=Physeter macrocephalus TaxID=9755 RepID=A0A455C7D4_PHYMC|nr:guanine nucleotide-binding protein subunit alpha-12 isoform X2 [Physeter catodon]|eukprot:XP_028355788.1 uncharacterized protein LOC114487812 [Physeter catodon]